jgi:acetyl-CoA carboxylase biotin carboxyl carrier protein
VDDKFYITLIDKFEKSSMTELEFSVDKIRLLLRKGSAAPPPASVFSNGALPPSPPQARRTAKAASFDGALSQDELNKVLAAGLQPTKAEPAASLTISSPIVATFYLTAGPDSPPYVQKGQTVKKGQTLCVLEAMKMMNHLEAEYDCEILDIKAANGDLVEFGQVLFEVKKKE